MKLVITENQFRALKESIDAYPNFILQQLYKIRGWLFVNLGLKSIIDDILDSVSKNISPEEIKKYKEGAYILNQNEKISNDTYNWFVDVFLPTKAKLVYDSEGNWHPVNKLNTNPDDLVELLTDLLFKSYETNDFVKELLEYITKNYKDVEGIKNIFTSNTENIQNLFIDRYKPTPTDVYGYVTNNIRLSEIGESIENEVKLKLESMGYTKKYQGGNSDYIDMVFSVDLIMESPPINGNVVKTLQVKSSKSGARKFYNEYKKERKHQAVDILVFPEDDKFVLYSLKDGVTKKINRKI